MNRIRDHFSRYLVDWRIHESFDWQAVLACLTGGLLLWPLVHRLPMLGWDWNQFFYPRQFAGLYPPWTEEILWPFSWVDWRASFSLVNSLALMTLAVATAQQARQDSRLGRLTAVVLAMLTPPIYMLLWQGNVDGLVLLGLVAMPLGVPLVLMKPTVAGWALLARRGWTLWGAAFGLISLLIWGLWPLDLLSAFDYRNLHPLAMGWQVLGFPLAIIGAILLCFTNADPFRLMAAGTFLAPYLQPVHFLVLVPAIGRVRGWKRILLWGWAWVVGLAPGFMGITKYLALGFPLAVWWLLRDRS